MGTQKLEHLTGASNFSLRSFPFSVAFVLICWDREKQPPSAFESLSDRCSFPGLAVDRLRPLCTAPGGKCLHGCSTPRWPDLQATSDFLKTKPGETSISGLATSDKTSDD